MVALVRPSSETSRKAGGGRSAEGCPPQHVTAASVEVAEEAAGAGSPNPSRSSGPGLRLVVDNSDDPRFGPETLVSGRLPAVDRGVLMVVVSVALLVFGSLFIVRVAQGSPAIGSVGPAGVVSQPGSGEGAGPEIFAVSGPSTSGQDVVTVTARAGDSMWSIARSLDPDSDPRPAVAVLIGANGSDSVSIGQQIVIPNELLD